MKRGRASQGQIQRRTKRPIDKKLMVVQLNNIVALQQGLTLTAGGNGAVFPGTLTGIRWSLSVVRTAYSVGTLSFMNWAIVVVPAGTAVSQLALGNGNSMYDPEQHVLAFGTAHFIENARSTVNTRYFEGSTKSMRKLKSGDNLMIIAFGTATEACSLFGTIQWFYKT